MWWHEFPICKAFLYLEKLTFKYMFGDFITLLLGEYTFWLFVCMSEVLYIVVSGDISFIKLSRQNCHCVLLMDFQNLYSSNWMFTEICKFIHQLSFFSIQSLSRNCGVQESCLYCILIQQYKALLTIVLYVRVCCKVSSEVEVVHVPSTVSDKTGMSYVILPFVYLLQ